MKLLRVEAQDLTPTNEATSTNGRATRRRAFRVGAIASFLLFSCTALAYAADNPCAALIPKSGAYSLTTSSGSSQTYNSAKELFCSSSFDQTSSSSGWAFNLDVPGYGSGGAGSSSSSSATRKAAFCSDSNKLLTTSDQVTLYRLQGDATLASEFVKCMGQRIKYYAVSGTSVGDAATLTITPHLSANAVERIISVSVLSGATPTAGVSISPGTALVGTSDVTGGYTLTGPAATFIIRTTTGDTQYVIRRCRNGTAAGNFTVNATTFSTQMQAAAGQVWHQPVPTAACHPKCKTVNPPNAEGGDLYQYQFAASPSLVLSNVRFGPCSGAGCPFADNWGASMLNAYTVNASVRSRSAPMVITVLADAAQPVQVGTPSQLSTGTITYGQPFSVLVPSSSAGVYLTFNGANYVLENLVDGAPFKIVSPKSSVGANTNYTLQMDDACGP